MRFVFDVKRAAPGLAAACWLALALLPTGCTRREPYFYEDLFIGAPKANPALAFLARRGGLMARCGGPNVVYGYGAGNYFYSNDWLQTFSAQAVYTGQQVLHWDAPTLVVRDTAGGRTRILASANHGASYTVRDSFWLPLLSPAGDTAYYAWSAAGATHTYFLQTRPVADSVRVFAPAADTFRWMGTVPALGVGLWLEMETPARGLLATLQGNAMLVWATADSGHTWAPPATQITGVTLQNYPYRLRRQPGGAVWVMGGGTAQEAVIFSPDGGSTWSVPTSLRNAVDIHWLSPQQGFALVRTANENADGPLFELRHTANGGHTWERTAPDSPLNAFNLHFFDPQNGIAYSGKILYGTQDGGRTWQLLMYPYPD
jgi:hypothetical protein